MFHKENEGVSSARNEGLTNATGEFIAFVDENISRLRYAIGNNKESISQEDKLVIRRCKEKLSNEINLN